MTTQEELVLLMTLPRGVDEIIIPGVLESYGIPVRLSERYFARQGRYVEIRVPASRVEDARHALDDARTVGQRFGSVPEELEQTPNRSELPRGVQIVAGTVFGLLTFLLSLASANLLLDPSPKNRLLSFVVGIVLLLLCGWILEMSYRLLTVRKNKGGLMSPTALRVVSAFFLVFPIVGIFTGYYTKMGWIAIYQAAMYVFAFIGLRKLASWREATLKAKERAEHL